MKTLNRAKATGFTLTEVLVTVGIVGTLSAMAVPTYIEETKKSSQNEAMSMIAQIMNQTAVFNDEFGTPATSWNDLDKIATIQTNSGSATANNFNWITLQPGQYSVMALQSGNSYTFKAAPASTIIVDPELPTPDNSTSLSNYNIVACLNVATGASDIRKGTFSAATSTSELNCN
jgi:type IV pilus assembly protein PilA